MTSNTQNTDSRDRMHADNHAVELAMREAVHDAVLAHKRLGLPMVEWQDGRIVLVPADELESDAEGGSPASQ
jgi:hypothetical protein